jgi:hypothetical protein
MKPTQTQPGGDSFQVLWLLPEALELNKSMIVAYLLLLINDLLR